MHALKRWLCASCLALTAPWSVAAAIHTYDGCTDAKGQPVASIEDNHWPQVAGSALTDGQPTVHYNPTLLPRLLPETRLFLYAQACSRHTLGLPITAALTAEQARRADCAALATLRRSHLVPANIVQALQVDLVLAPEEWAQVAGPVRTLDLASCDLPTGTGSGAGTLNVPPTKAAPSEKWNACIQSCAARSFTCEQRQGAHAAACTSAYDQCSARCSP
ncbi:MAG: hypothetical protein QM639_03095 [Rhodocyclaceae bacterium]